MSWTDERIESLRRNSEQTREAIRFYAEHGGNPGKRAGRLRQPIVPENPGIQQDEEELGRGDWATCL